MRLSKFLKKHKAYKQFKKNFDVVYNDYRKGDKVSILNAFHWGDSLEGFTYWNNIDDAWDDVKKKKYDLIVENNNTIIKEG